jgi:EmrB/QacA subfamily drug resistance transporter
VTEDRIDPALRRLMIVMLLGGIMGVLDTTVVNVALDRIAARMHTSLGTIQWLPTGYLLTFAIVIPTSTWAIARFGGRRLWLTGLSVFLVGSALCALAWDPASLIGFRIVQGIGAGILEPTLMTVLATAAGPARMGKTMGVLGTIVALGPIVGPILGSVIVAHADWRWIFAINLPIGLTALLLAIRIVPRDGPHTRPRLDICGIGLLSAGFALLVFGLSRTDWIPIAVGVVLLVGYVLYAARSDRAPVAVRLFMSRGFTLGVAAMFFVGGALFSLLFLLPLYFQQQRGYGVFDAGLLLVPQGVGAWIGMPVAGRLADRIGARLLVSAGATMAALGVIPYAVGHSPLALLAAASLVTGFGLGCIGAPSMTTIYRSVEPASVPGATTAIYVLNQIGAAAMVTTAALLLRHQDSFTTAFWTVAGILLAIAVLGRFIPRVDHAHIGVDTPDATPISA